MDPNTPEWEEPASGIKILRLYRTELNPHWPRIVVLDLTDDRFREFEQDPLAFDKKHGLYPEQPILWISSGSKPPQGQGISRMADPSRHTVVILHRNMSCASWAASPQ
jgi:hypothetical protein